MPKKRMNNGVADGATAKADKTQTEIDRIETKTYKLEITNAIDDVENLISISNQREQTEVLKTQQDLESELAYREKMRKEQVSRAEQISKLFSNYRVQQEKRAKYKQNMKPTLVWFLFAVIGWIALTFALCLLAILWKHDLNAPVVGVIITSFVTSFGTILSLVLIVVKYVFPEDEDKDFNDLIKAIIANDTTRIKDENTYQLDRRKNDKDKKDEN